MITRTRAAGMAGSALFAIVVSAVWWIPLVARPGQITRENGERIDFGMTRTQVEALLGPERDETDGRVVVWFLSRPPCNLRTTKCSHWVTKRLAITVGFDAGTDCVVGVRDERSILQNATIPERIESWVLDQFEQ